MFDISTVGAGTIGHLMKKTSIALKTAATLILVSHSHVAISADAIALTDEGLELSITANRVLTPLDKTLSSVTVLTAADIEKQQASSLPELLQATAGIQLVNNGGAGKVTSLFMRGTESDHTLVLLDGVRINSVSDGGASLQLLPIEMIERVEIVRGARTSLYGSDAIGGVIQIFTKKGKKGAPAKPYAIAKIGSHGSRALTLGVNGGFTKGSYSLSVKRENTDGYNSCTGDSVNFAGCFTEELDDDGYDNKSVTFNSSLQLNESNTLSAHFLRSKNELEFDGAAPFSPNEAEITTQIYGLSLATKLNEKANLVFSAGRNENKNKNKQSGAFFNDYNTSRDNFSLLSNIAISPKISLVIGADYSDDKADNVTNYPEVPSRSNKGLFFDYKQNVGKADFQAGFRHDSNKLYGDKNTGNIGFGYDIKPNLKIVGSYSTAFKAPTFDELYFPGFGVPTIKPEEAKVTELGLRGNTTWGKWSTYIFHNEIDNLIVFKSDFSSADNIDKATIKGFEAIVDSKIMGWDVNTQFTLLDAEDRSANANQGKKLARRPAKSLRLNLQKDYGKFTLGGTMIAEDHRFDNASNSRRINGYATVDLLASYKLAKNLTVQAKVGNIFDKNYETASFYPQDGRNAMLSLSYSAK
jgi:vitamin B12 transporter